MERMESFGMQELNISNEYLFAVTTCVLRFFDDQEFMSRGIIQVDGAIFDQVGTPLPVLSSSDAIELFLHCS